MGTLLGTDRLIIVFFNAQSTAKVILIIRASVSFGKIPAMETAVFWVRGLAQQSAEVSDLTDGEIKKMLQILDVLKICSGCVSLVAFRALFPPLIS